jgi:hypothetical protein
MEWWSDGIVQKPTRSLFWVLAFYNTPILQNSSTPIPFAIFTCRAIGILIASEDLLFYD